MVFRLLRYLRIGLYWVISINPTRRKWFNCLIQRTCCHRNIPLLILSESMDAKFPTTFQSRSQTIHQRQCRWLKYILMPVCVFCFFHPISRSRNRPEVFFASFAGIVNKSCAIQSVLSLVDTLTAVFSLEILSHGRAPFPQRRKEHTTTLYSIAHGALFLKASPRIFQMQCQITSA